MVDFVVQRCPLWEYQPWSAMWRCRQVTIDLSILGIFPALGTATIHMRPQSEAAVSRLKPCGGTTETYRNSIQNYPDICVLCHGYRSMGSSAVPIPYPPFVFASDRSRSMVCQHPPGGRWWSMLSAIKAPWVPEPISFEHLEEHQIAKAGENPSCLTDR